MDEEAARLQAIGIHVIGDTVDARVHAEHVRIARRLRAAGRKVIGLIPAGPDAAVPPVAVNLGMALIELTGATVAFVDANVHWPAISQLAVGERTDRDESLFTTRWLRGSLALLTPPRAVQVGLVGPQLRRAVAESKEIFEFVLVDLTGFELLGEQPSASDLMDALIVVARAQATREADLLRFGAELDRAKYLGVLLVG